MVARYPARDCGVRLIVVLLASARWDDVSTINGVIAAQSTLRIEVQPSP